MIELEELKEMKRRGEDERLGWNRRRREKVCLWSGKRKGRNDREGEDGEGEG